MKKVLKTATAATLVLAMMLTMAACATLFLEGTYVAKDAIVDYSFTFKEDNRVAFSILGVEAEGDYEIKDGELIITYSLLGLKKDFTFSFERKGDTVFIDGVEYVKQ